MGRLREVAAGGTPTEIVADGGLGEVVAGGSGRFAGRMARLD